MSDGSCKAILVEWGCLTRYRNTKLFWRVLIGSLQGERQRIPHCLCCIRFCVKSVPYRSAFVRLCFGLEAEPLSGSSTGAVVACIRNILFVTRLGKSYRNHCRIWLQLHNPVQILFPKPSLTINCLEERLFRNVLMVV